MDIAGEGDRIITTWDGLTHWVVGLVCSGIAGLVPSGLGAKSSRGGRDGGFNGNGAFPISSEALGKMTGGLVTGFRSNDVTCGVSKEG